MANDDFDPYVREYNGIFLTNANLDRAVELWLDYYDTCETYDRTVCTGMRRGVAVPMTGEQAGLIGKHADRQRAEMVRKMIEAELDDSTVERAKEIALREHKRRFGGERRG